MHVVRKTKEGLSKIVFDLKITFEHLYHNMLEDGDFELGFCKTQIFSHKA
jgi:hypothetical protein